MRAAASLTWRARARAEEAFDATVKPGAVKDKMVVWICWLVLNRWSLEKDQSGIVQPEGPPPAARRAFCFQVSISAHGLSLSAWMERFLLAYTSGTKWWWTSIRWAAIAEGFVGCVSSVCDLHDPKFLVTSR